MAPDPLRDLAARILERCLHAGVTIATAESCTGGLVGDALTDVPGSSASYLGGVVAYGDAAKAALLGVPRAILAAHGAVSAQAARAMAVGARSALGADVAVAITGIAGPGGGTAEKPVGLAYVAVADARGVEVRRHGWTGDRAANKAASAAAALELLEAHVAWLVASSSPAGATASERPSAEAASECAAGADPRPAARHGPAGSAG